MQNKDPILRRDRAVVYAYPSLVHGEASFADGPSIIYVEFEQWWRGKVLLQ